jgi:hypothetical protein
VVRGHVVLRLRRAMTLPRDKPAPRRLRRGTKCHPSDSWPKATRNVALECRKAIMKNKLTAMTNPMRMKLFCLAALTAAGFTSQAQYIYTTLDDPLAGHGAGPDTLTDNFSGTNIVGGYGNYFSSGIIHGFLLSGTNWTTLNNPLAGSASGQGTYATSMSGTNVVGWYIDGSGVVHGFLKNGSTWTTLDNPQADLSPSGGTYAQGIDGTNISGFCTDASGINHGFLYNLVAKAWTSLNNPLAGSGSGQGTLAERISGTNIVGVYRDSSGKDHGFLYNLVANTWTTLNAPLAGSGGTIAFNISGTNIVGIYINSSGNNHGFLLSGTNWTTLNDPLAGSASGQGTYALGIEGATIVGLYIDKTGVSHGFLATPKPQLAITLSGNALTVSWPYWNNLLTGWTLQQSPDLSTTNWTPSGGSVSNDGTNNFFTITPSAGNSFFRLNH